MSRTRAGSTVRAARRLVFCDGFADAGAGKWKPVSGTWKVHEDAYEERHPSMMDNHSIATMADAPGLADMELTLRTKLLVASPSGYSFTLFRVQDHRNYYGLSVRLPDNAVWLERKKHGHWQALAARHDFGITADTWYRVRIRAVGNTLQGKVWNESVKEPAAWLFTIADSAFSSGGVGVMSGFGTHVAFADVKVWALEHRGLARTTEGAHHD
jgi:hypothetical protein